MTLTVVDEVAALIIFDQQKLNQYELGRGLPAELVVPLPDVIARTAELATAFRARDWPVAYAKVPNAHGIARLKRGENLGGRIDKGYTMSPNTPDDFDDIVPELTPQPGDLVFAKPMWDPFIGTSLDYDLRQHGVTQIYVTGLMTSIGVESAARSGWNLGYNMVFITDVMTDFDEAAHRHSIEKIFPRIGESTTAAAVLSRIG
ncbi:cysteine hydrolase [Nocardia alni]|uniref:cysteine hydrolase n=1 Tax=Nocardia alni TaxID=2815723 RepID=UPI001C221E7B|nr:cysteine hydrolase [Nocardia alni]